METPPVTPRCVERRHDLVTVERLFQRLVDAGHAVHRPVAGPSQARADAGEDDRQDRRGQKRKERQLPADEERQDDADQRLERLLNDLPSHQPQAGRHHVHVIREMGHQLRRPFERDGLVVEAEHAPEAVLTDPHQRQLDELRDQRLLHELASALSEREQHLSGEDQGQQVELVSRQPRHDARLDPTENHQLVRGRAQDRLFGRLPAQGIEPFPVVRSLLGVKSLELVFALVDGPLFFLDHLFRLDDHVVDVFLDRLVLKQQRDDWIGRGEAQAPKSGHQQ